MTTIHLELHVPNLEQAKAFYGALGFTAVWQHPGPGDDAYLVLGRGGAVLTFWAGTIVPFAVKGPSGRGVEIVVADEGLDDVYAKAQRLGVVYEPMMERPWGLRDFRVLDPFGFYLRFTEPHDVTAPDYGGRPN